MEKFVITTFYQLADLGEYYFKHRAKLLKFCNDHGIKGTILLAQEGVNSTITGTREAIDLFYGFMKKIPAFASMTYKESFCAAMPFKRMKIKLKKEVVTFKQELDMNDIGTYLGPKEWDDLISNPDTFVIDCRNDYEIIFGTFKNAIDPKTRNFTELVEWSKKHLEPLPKDKPIAMFCTGGIRCEKSTAYAKKLGFKNVYHVKGGILEYLEKSKNQNQMWQGRCFVFDDRIAVDANLEPYHLASTSEG